MMLMDFFLTDNAVRAKIKCCVCNCFGCSLSWAVDVLLHFQYGCRFHLQMKQIGCQSGRGKMRKRRRIS